MLNTRIQLKYDSFTNWKNNNPTLLSGEVAIVSIESAPTQEVDSVAPPQILFKVGPGAFNDLPWASGCAADVYSWAKQSGLSINKDGTGNVVSGIEWDAAANNGKGGIKFTTAAVATSEGLQGVQDRLAALEAEMGDVANDYANSRIDVLEKTISDNQANWAKDNDTTYTFEEIKDENQKVTGIKVTPKGGSAQSISFNFLTEEALDTFLASEDHSFVIDSAQVYNLSTYNKINFTDDGEYSQELVADYENQTFKIVGATEKTIATVDQIPTELGVMDVDGENAIEVTGDANKIVKLKINSNKGNVTFDNTNDGLRANVDLSTLVPQIKVNNATNADKLGGQEPSYYAVDTLVVHTSEKGSANGVATLDANGKVPASQLPSYVDDIVEGYYNVETGKFYTDTTEVTEIIAETGKIYVEANTNKTYRWSGAQYVEISASLALGETSATAYAGDKGKALAEKVARIENVVQWIGDQPQIIGDVDSGLIIDGKADLYLNTAGVMRAEADSNIELNSENITVTAKAVEVGSANGEVLIKSDLKVDSSIQIKEPTTGTYGNLAKYNSGVLEIGSTTGAGTRIKGANASGVVIDSDVVQLGSTAVFKANPNKIVEVGRTDYTLQFKGSAAPTWTDGTNTKTVAMTDALNSYLPLSGGIVENLTVDDTLEVDYIKLGAVNGEYTLNIHTTGDRVVVDVPVDDSTEEKELAYRADIPTNVVQYYEGTSLDDEEPVFVFCCGSASKLV